MGRQSTCRLVLLLAFSLALIHASHASTLPAKIHLVHDDVKDNELSSAEEVSPAESLPKISTPKVRVEETTTKSPPAKKSTEKSLSEEAIKDLLEAAKHSQALAEDPHFNKMLKTENATTSSSVGGKNSTDSDENYEYDNYAYDDEDYNYFDEDKETTPASAKKGQKASTAKPKLVSLEGGSASKSKVS